MRRLCFPYLYGQEQAVIEPSRLKRAATALFGAPHLGERSRHQQLMKGIKLLPSLDKATILNAGSANGAHSFYLARRFPSWRIIGIERDGKKVEDALRIKRAYRFSNVDFTVGDLRKMRYRNQFDFIFSISVLNYIDNDAEVLDRFYRALKPAGYLILNVPSLPRKPVLAFLRMEIERQNDQEAMGSPLLGGKGYSKEGLQQIAGGVGFKAVHFSNPCGLASQLAWELSCGLDRHLLPKVFFRPFLLALTFFDQFAESRPYPANVDCLFVGQKRSTPPSKGDRLFAPIRWLNRLKSISWTPWFGAGMEFIQSML